MRNSSRADLVLAALYDAASGTTESVAYEETVLSAWRLFPESFSLATTPNTRTPQTSTGRFDDQGAGRDGRELANLLAICWA